MLDGMFVPRGLSVFIFKNLKKESNIKKLPQNRILTPGGVKHPKIDPWVPTNKSMFEEENLKHRFFGNIFFTKTCFSRVVGCFWLPGPWTSSPGWSSSYIGCGEPMGDEF